MYTVTWTKSNVLGYTWLPAPRRCIHKICMPSQSIIVKKSSGSWWVTSCRANEDHFLLQWLVLHFGLYPQLPGSWCINQISLIWDRLSICITRQWVQPTGSTMIQLACFNRNQYQYKENFLKWLCYALMDYFHGTCQWQPLSRIHY